MIHNDSEITREVMAALAEDIGSGDISAALIPPETQATASIVTREMAVIAGQAWVTEVFRQLDPRITVYWLVKEGACVMANQAVCLIKGSARSILSGERCALNFLQTISATATITASYVQCLQRFNTTLLDTRKTIPGLRYAQKYAVTCGGATNHRMGLYDAFLIKENHIMSCGSITKAVNLARQQHPSKRIEVEVENVNQLREALDSNTDIIMLDNFTVAEARQAVELTQQQAKLEISGSIDLASIQEYAAVGVDFISVGALTKHIRAIDLSMRVQAN